VAALGFDPTAPTEAGRTALVVIYAVVPCVIKVLAVAMIWRFPLTRQKHGIIVRRLARHHGSRQSEAFPA
jgi:Na+/melibiose symporter-like transporter